ncbi:MAG: hypothetical protein ABH865_01855 [Candidatus Omnitrophota bacterium]
MKLNSVKKIIINTGRCIVFVIYLVLLFVIGGIWLRLSYNMVSPYNKERLRYEVIGEYNYFKSLLDKPDTKTKTVTDGWNNFQPSEWPFQVLSLFTYGTRNLAQAGIIPKNEASRYMKIAIERAMKPEYYNFIVPHFGDPFKDAKIKDNAFYLGHFVNMLALYREVSGDSAFDELFHKFAHAFYINFKANPYSCLASYPGMTWTSEQAVPLRALKYHDDIFGTNYMEEVNRWKETMEARYTDPKANVLITGVESDTGKVWSGPRVIPNAWTILFLHQVLPGYCQELYKNTKQAFLIKRLGLPVFTEWLYSPQISDGDTGPIIWGASPAGTCFVMGSAGIYADSEVFWSVNIIADTIGLPVTIQGKRKYLLGSRIGTACFYFCRSMAFVSTKDLKPFPVRRLTTLYLIVSALLLIIMLRIRTFIKYFFDKRPNKARPSKLK